MRMSIRDMQRILQDAADILEEIGSNTLGQCEEQACLNIAVARRPNEEYGHALCSEHCGPADVATQGYRWSNLWNLADISIIAESWVLEYQASLCWKHGGIPSP